MFLYGTQAPLDKLNVFGSNPWLKANRWRVAIVFAMLLLISISAFYFDYYTLCYVLLGWACLPILAIFSLGSVTPELIRPAILIMLLPEFLMRFYACRNESI